MATLNESLGSALERFEGAVKQLLEVRLRRPCLGGSCDREPPVWTSRSPTQRKWSPPVSTAARSQSHRATRRWLRLRVGLATSPTYLKQFNKFWGAGDGVKAAAGSNGHQVVLKVGHAFGKKFKPWEAVKTANTIGKVAKVGGVAIAVGLEATASLLTSVLP